MDTLTHALSGALLARATAPATARAGELTPRARMAFGFVAAAFPDSDFVLRLFDTLTYISLHRGVTHSIVLLPAWALFVAWLLSLLSGRRYTWQAIYRTAALGIAVHIAGDLFTAYGTMLLAPFSYHRFAIPFTFIIDPYFTAIIAIGLVAAVLKPRRQYPAVIASLALVCYVACLGILHSKAIEIGEAYVQNRGLKDAEVHAVPQPLSPFNWKVIVSREDVYQVANINLWREERREPPGLAGGILGTWGRIAAGYQPVSKATWVRHSQFGETESENGLAREAWSQDIFARFRQFAMFPVLDKIEFFRSGVCVSFFDLRFTLPSLPPSLGFGLCRDSSAHPWRLEHDRGLLGRN